MLHKNELGHLFEHIPASQRRAKDGGGLGTTKQLVIGWGTCAWSDFHYNTIDKPSYSLCTACWARLGSIKFILLIHYRDFQTYCMHRYFYWQYQVQGLGGLHCPCARPQAETFITKGQTLSASRGMSWHVLQFWAIEQVSSFRLIYLAAWQARNISYNSSCKKSNFSLIPRPGYKVTEILTHMHAEIVRKSMVTIHLIQAVCTRLPGESRYIQNCTWSCRLPQCFHLHKSQSFRSTKLKSP